MKTKNQIDMLNGTLADKIIMFALPLAARSILQQLFNSADVACVLRLIYVFTVVPKHNSFDMFMLVYPFSWIFTTTVLVICYLIVSRRYNVKWRDSN